MKKILVFICLFVLLSILLAACSSNTSSTPSPATSSSNGQVADGKTLLETRCVGCHTLAQVVNRTGDASQWKKAVDNMINRGAVLSADEETVLVQYLAANFK
jgi:cytochrome c5